MDGPTKRIEVVVLEPSQLPTKGQVVEQPRSINKEEPKHSKYLSAENQRVEKETRARKTGDFNNEAGGGGRAPFKVPPPASRKQQAALKKNTSQRRQKQPPKDQQKPIQEKTNTGTISVLKDLIPKVDFTLKQKTTQNDPKIQKNQRELSSKGAQHQRKAGRESATRDYLKDKKKGIQTLLNTREFAYYSYYHRIRQKIQVFWEPAIKQKVRHLFASGRKLASVQDRVTKLIIVLDKKGRLVSVQVLGESGVRDLDEAAVEAFRTAEPFPNPPKGMAENDGKIRIRWDFVLEV